MESVRLKIHQHMALVGEEIVYVLEKRTTTTHAIVRAFVLERLSAAAGVMCSLFLREMETLETLLERQNKLLDAKLQPRVTLHRADLLHLPVCEEVSAEQPQPPQIKEEQEELLQIKDEQEELLQIKEEQEELLHRPVEAEASTQTLLAVNSEDDESDTTTQHMETHADVEYCTSQPFRNGQFLSSHSSAADTEDSDSSHSSESDSDDWEEIREDKSLSPDIKSPIQTHSVRSQKAKMMLSCTECGEIFPDKGRLDRHTKIHTGEKPFTCTICGKGCNYKCNLTVHMRRHTGGKRFSCTFCGNDFSRNSYLKVHMRRHTEGKHFSGTVVAKPV